MKSNPKNEVLTLSFHESALLKAIETSEMSSVVFIRDYIQLVFENDKETVILTAFTLPTVLIKNELFNKQVVGYCDALCSLINQAVKKALVEEGIAISLLFENEELVKISLREEDYKGTEAAMFSSVDGISVW
ncbi:hypothetical protein Back11_08150 [Paenibacillus baekrokdamisoli]|uniref:Uncharacterized protein n=1 Tax=Paenibacillus baekrokdamisoli TaxID=1712516 RepID=A0A3G9IKP5_9BACL|nr:hypothetical protein [Paenibacillus baekrokdamisoli]MBB3067344.1 hypothetical protein [Paenibacillus baekrokdamisoli]BBH19470.1 hypothetical protein Back11_08150 [Paenibacillus baekrokdamisoli]